MSGEGWDYIYGALIVLTIFCSIVALGYFTG